MFSAVQQSKFVNNILKRFSKGFQKVFKRFSKGFQKDFLRQFQNVIESKPLKNLGGFDGGFEGGFEGGCYHQARLYTQVLQKRLFKNGSRHLYVSDWWF